MTWNSAAVRRIAVVAWLAATLGFAILSTLPTQSAAARAASVETSAAQAPTGAGRDSNAAGVVAALGLLGGWLLLGIALFLQGRRRLAAARNGESAAGIAVDEPPDGRPAEEAGREDSSSNEEESEAGRRDAPA